MPKTVVNLGCGPRAAARLPVLFENWRELRVDVDPAMEPDVVADMTDLSAIESGSADALWSSHSIEHLYLHQVGQAIAEFYRILSDDGFACIIVPDLQTLANYIVADKLHEVVYQSQAGPITAHDIVFGLGGAIARGRVNMAHRCGFTPSLMLQQLRQAPFAEIVLRRRPNMELAAVACKTRFADQPDREALLAALEL
jgi:predicted SAM-dependent methyltransferase